MKTVEVVTRYGSKHLARMPKFPSPYSMRQRFFTLCMGTSSWTVDEWIAEDDHPLLTIEEIRTLEMNCDSCKRLAATI